MTADKPTTAGEHSPTSGLLEDRTLDFFQVVDIGRLQTEIIALRANALIGLTGIGPRGSNETSKTTLLAAIGVPTGLPTWRIDSGQTGQYVADLLFDPPNIDPDRHVRADLGFIVAVFGRPGQTLDGRRDNLTVWVRVRRSSPYLQFRLADGAHVIRGDNHIERVTKAPVMWDDLPSRPTYGPKDYVKTVLGGMPRSTGYVSELGDMPIRHGGLLTTPLKSLTPRDIGDELVNLSGLRPRVERERQRRAAAHRLRGDVEDAESNLRSFRERVNAELDTIEHRKGAATLVRSAAALRSAQVAAQVGDILERRAELADEHRRILDSEQAETLRRQVDTAERTVARLRDVDTLTAELDGAHQLLDRLDPPARGARKQIEDLQIEIAAIGQRLADPELAGADRHSGRTIDTIRTELDDALAERRRADAETLAEEEAARRAREHLERVQAGTAATPAAEVLLHAGIDNCVIGDAVEPTSNGATFWDVALAPWREAVAVYDIEAAIEACGELPGTLLVAGGPYDGDLPAGIADAPQVCRPFLDRLAHTAASEGDAHVRLSDVLTVVVGGWDQPQQGREARIAAARAHLHVLESELAAATAAVDEAHAAVDELGSELTAAEAYRERQKRREEQDELSRDLVQARRDSQELLARHGVAERQVRDLTEQLESREERLDEAETSLANAQAAYEAEVTNRVEEIRSRAERQQLGWWATRLARTSNPDGEDRMTGDLSETIESHDLDALELPEEVSQALRDGVTAVLAPHAETGRSLKVESLARTAREHLEEATRNLGILARTGDDGQVRVTAPEGTPHRVVVAVRERSEAESSKPRGVETFDRLVAVLTDYLAPVLERDADREMHLRQQLDDKQEEVEAKREAWERADVGAQSLQSSLDKLAATRFAKIRAGFVRQVAADSGDAADLDVDVVLPGQDDVTREMRWDVTPRWARQAGGKPVDYQRAANFAQYKVKAIQLVLAALAADDQSAGRLLLLDEVSAGLDVENREVVLRALAEVARRDEVTVIATVQDDLLPVVAPHVGQLLVLRYPDRSRTYNDPTRMLASGPDGRLVGLEDALREGRGFGFAPDDELFADILNAQAGIGGDGRP